MSINIDYKMSGGRIKMAVALSVLITACSSVSWGEQVVMEVKGIVHDGVKVAPKKQNPISAKFAKKRGKHILIIKNTSKEDLSISKDLSGWSIKYNDRKGAKIEEGGTSVTADPAALDHLILKPGETHEFALSLKSLEGGVSEILCRLDFGMLVPSYGVHCGFSVDCRVARDEPKVGP